VKLSVHAFDDHGIHMLFTPGRTPLLKVVLKMVRYKGLTNGANEEILLGEN
jgi:hypothetical protein